MKPVALELSDRAVSIAKDGQVLASSQSAIFDGSGAERAGTNAWSALRRQPTSIATRHLSAVVSRGERSARNLALLNAEFAVRLAEYRPAPGEPVWIVAPARISAAGLGEVLGLLRSLGLSIHGFVDSAAVTVAALRPERSALVVELGLHHLAVTAVESNGQTHRRRAVTSDGNGLIQLSEAWLDLISAAMVKRTRFDPLHDAASEQQLFDALPILARDAASTGSAVARVTVANERFEVSLSRDQFAEAAQPVYREVLRLLHALRPAGAPVALVMPGLLVELPGLRELLGSFVGCELIGVPDGFAAAATSMLDLPEVTEEQTVRLLRRLPSSVRPEVAALARRENLGEQHASGPLASHLLLAGKAYTLTDLLVIGRAPDSAHSITLPEGLAGVSRRHCTLVRDRGELVLVDHSSYGTLVNGERVSERVRLHAGDRIHIGDPGVELSLLSLAQT